MKLQPVQKLPYSMTTTAIYIAPFVAAYRTPNGIYIVSSRQDIALPFDLPDMKSINLPQEIARSFGFELNPKTVKEYDELALCTFIACNITNLYFPQFEVEKPYVTFYKYCA